MDPGWEATDCVPPKSKALMAGGGMRRGWQNLVLAVGGSFWVASHSDCAQGRWVGRGAAAVQGRGGQCG